MKRPKVVVAGLAVAAAIPAAYLSVTAPLGGERDLSSIAASFVVIGYFTAITSIVLGAPLFLALDKFKLVTWWSSVGGGLLVGVGAVAVVTATGDVDRATVATFGVLGGVAGLAFWLVLRLGRADS